MTLIRKTVAFSPETWELWNEAASDQNLSLSMYLRLVALKRAFPRIMALPAPADLPWPIAQAKAIIEEERARLLRNKRQDP